MTTTDELGRIAQINRDCLGLTGKKAHRHYQTREAVRDHLRTLGYTQPGQLEMLVSAAVATGAAASFRAGHERVFDLDAALAEVRAGAYGIVLDMGREADADGGADARSRLERESGLSQAQIDALHSTERMNLARKLDLVPGPLK